MKHLKFFAALCCVAAAFAACEPQNGPNANTNYYVTVKTADALMGTVSGGGIYPSGTEVTITALANEGYKFVQWNDNNTDNSRTITVTSDVTYVATFAESDSSNDDNTDKVLTCAEAINHVNENVVVEGYVAFAYDYAGSSIQSAWIADDPTTNVGVFEAYKCTVNEAVSKGDRVHVEGQMIIYTKSNGEQIFEIKGGVMTRL
ncbi:MAG: hypothetical protein ACI392_01670 [Paludibacteraceae bacterium]